MRAEQVPHPLFLMQAIKPSTGGGPDSSPHLSLQHLGCSGKAGVGAGLGGQAAGQTHAATNQTSPGRSPAPSSNSAEGPQERTRRHPGGPAHSRHWTSHPPTQLRPAADATSPTLRKHRNDQEITQKDPAGRIPGARPTRTRPLPTPTPTLPRRLAKQDHRDDSKAQVRPDLGTRGQRRRSRARPASTTHRAASAAGPGAPGHRLPRAHPAALCPRLSPLRAPQAREGPQRQPLGVVPDPAWDPREQGQNRASRPPRTTETQWVASLFPNPRVSVLRGSTSGSAATAAKRAFSCKTPGRPLPEWGCTGHRPLPGQQPSPSCPAAQRPRPPHGPRGPPDQGLAKVRGPQGPASPAPPPQQPSPRARQPPAPHLPPPARLPSREV